MVRFSPSATLFLVFLTITVLIWLLRGMRLISFMPSSILWVLLFLTIGAAIVSGLQATR